MDSVEIIMAVEEAFEIEIPDEEAADVITVIDMYNLVWSKLRPGPLPRCPSSALFYRTRRAMMEALGVPRWSVYPLKRMEELLPVERRRSDWQQLQRSTGVWLPNLELPKGSSGLLSAFTWVLFLLCLAAYFVSPLADAVLFSLAGILLASVVHRAVAPFATCIPVTCATVRSTVRYAVTRNKVVYPRAGDRWEPAVVWKTLRRVIVEQLDIPPEEVTPEASFVDDLGVD
jgi:acyl carrier protein